MRVVVFGASGNTGGVVARRLLEKGVEVVAVSRQADRVADLTDRGADVATGAPDDAAFVQQAMRGADAVFWMTPPGYAVDDYRAFQEQTADNAAAAIREQRIARVVNLSSFGAQLAQGNGPIGGLHRVEAILDASGASLAHVRPAMYFENYKSAAGSIAATGKIFMPIGGSVRTSMVATRDAGEVAASLLLDDGWNGRLVRGVLGPVDLDFDEAAAAIGSGLGRSVSHVAVSPDDARAAMLARGVRPGFVDGIIAIYGAVQEGRLVPAEARDASSTSPTRLEDWARDVLAPMVAAAG